MLTENQKRILEEQIYNLIKDSIDESLFEKKRRWDTKDIRRETDTNQRRRIVLKWLDSDLELHSELAYKLWPRKSEDAARSLFSKKYKGQSQGKHYEFTPSEINRLYNLRGQYIKRVGKQSKTTLSESLERFIYKSVKDVLNEIEF